MAEMTTATDRCTLVEAFVEFEALIYWAFVDHERAERLGEEIVTYRERAMEGYGPPSDDADSDDTMLTHADATARLYLETDELAKETGHTLTAVRSTAMLLTFAGLLREFPLGPVNYLMAPDPERPCQDTCPFPSPCATASPSAWGIPRGGSATC